MERIRKLKDVKSNIQIIGVSEKKNKTPRVGISNSRKIPSN
jgi:hypothetical protein